MSTTDYTRRSETEELPEKWAIRSDRMAQWAMRKLARAQAEVDRIKAAAAEERERIAQWEEYAGAGAARDVEFFREHLTRYHRARNVEPFLEEAKVGEEGGPSLEEAWARFGHKTHKLPVGAISARIRAGKIEVADEAAFLEWLERTVATWKDVRQKVELEDEATEQLEHELEVLEDVAPAVRKVHKRELGTADVFSIAGDVVTFADEIVPGLRWATPELTYDAGPDLTLEQPAWLPMPELEEDDPEPEE